MKIATILVAIFVALAFLGGIAALLALIGFSAS